MSNTRAVDHVLRTVRNPNVELYLLRMFYAQMQSYADPMSSHHAGSQVGQAFRRASHACGLTLGSDVDRLSYHPATHPFSIWGAQAQHIGSEMLMGLNQPRPATHDEHGMAAP